MKTKIVSIRDLWVCRGKNAVLEDINLQLDEADFLGLIGPNGGGKSTLLKVMLGLIKPDRGEIRIFGLEPQAGPRTHRIHATEDCIRPELSGQGP